MSQETSFEYEAGTNRFPRLRRWCERGVVLTGSVAIAGALFSGTAQAQPALPSSGSAGIIEQAGLADDDMHPLDWQIMQTWLAQKLGAGFQRFLNGDGGGTGYEGGDTSAQFVADGPPPCPMCGESFPATPEGWQARELHALMEWPAIQDAIQQGLRNGLGTGSANGLWNNMTITPVSDSCPVCGLGGFSTDGNGDQGAAALAEHLFQEHFAEWLRTQAVALGTGSAV